jgi:hypothetical protein
VDGTPKVILAEGSGHLNEDKASIVQDASEKVISETDTIIEESQLGLFINPTDHSLDKAHDDDGIFVTFISATIGHVASDLYGGVSKAEIRLTGPLRTIFLIPLERDLAVLSNQFQSFTFGTTTGDTDDRPKMTFNIYFDIRGPRLMREDHIHCLLFCKGKDKEEFMWSGLPLEPTSTRKGQFRRLGILHLYTNCKNPPWLNEEEPSRAQESNFGSENIRKSPEIDRLEYESFDGKTYTISIV